MTWTWRLEDSSGAPVEPVAVARSDSQSDAESWLGENWRELREAGVAQVVLLDAGTEVYGPMPLSE